jgi:hypothetical protein
MRRHESLIGRRELAAAASHSANFEPLAAKTARAMRQDIETLISDLTPD